MSHCWLLQTLGHLEKAVVLELTLKHVKALTSLLEQQQQKILALQNGMQLGEWDALVHTHTDTHTHTRTFDCMKARQFQRYMLVFQHLTLLQKKSVIPRVHDFRRYMLLKRSG